MHSVPLRRVLPLLAPLLLTTSGCIGEPQAAPFVRYGALQVRLEQGFEDGTFASLIPVAVSFAWAEGSERDCALASEGIEATVNGQRMAPMAGVAHEGSRDNANCLAPEFRWALSREEALRDGGRLEIVVREGGDEVRLVAEGMFAPRGVLGQERWQVRSGEPTVLPWVPASDDLAELRGSSMREAIGMQPVAEGLRVTGYREDYVNRRLIVSGDVSVRVATCEGIARCTARQPFYQVLDLDIF